MKVKKQGILLSYFLVEILLLNLAFFIVSYWSEGVLIKSGYFLLLVLFNFSWLSIVFINGPQEVYVRYKLKKRLKDLLLNYFLFLGITSPLIMLFGEDEYSRNMVLGTTLLFSTFSFLFFLLSSNSLMAIKRSNFSSKLLILGAEEKGRKVYEFTQKNKHLGYEVVGFLDNKVSSNGINVLGRVEELPEVLNKTVVDEIVIALPSYQEKEIKYAIETADFEGIRVNVIPDFVNSFGINHQAYTLDEIPIIEMHHIPLDSSHNYFLKRLFDMAFAMFILILFSPFLIAIALWIKLDSKGPVFYKPVRKGLSGNKFTCFKFRTMYTDLCEDPSNGTRSTTKDDPRVTRAGRFLRKRDLDELPQFINVLFGQMSVVGPRPHRVNLNSELQHHVKKYMFRTYVRPGITGWAQVNGWRGPTETEEQKLERIRHDLWYIENWSFMLDLKIIFLTAFGNKVRRNAF